MHKAKGTAAGVGAWINNHRLQAGLIGAGLTIGSVVAGWLIFKILRGKKSRNGRRNHRRSVDVADDFMAEFPKNAVEKRAIMDEIDWDDEEFLEFLSLLPDVQQLLAEEEL